MSKKILVTGCGGDIGQSMCKILQELNHVVFGLDCSEKNAAQFIIKEFNVGLKCTNELYLKSLEDFVLKYEIEIVLPISEPELRFFTKTHKNIINIGAAKILMANDLAREIGFDKLLTCNFLEDNNLPFPKLIDIKGEKIEYPIIGKSRTGSGSSKVFKIENEDEFEFIKSKYDNFVFQNYLNEKNGEYTCGLFRSSQGVIRTIIFKRELTGGYSGYGEVVKDKAIDDLLYSIADLLLLRGSINVQLRIHEGEPTVFEINPRFSSTVLFRHMFGFKDVQWSLEDLLSDDVSEYIAPNAGSKFYKGFQEYIK